MHPTLMLLPLLAFLLLLRGRAHAGCEPATCGNVTVKYPFWLGGPNQPPSALSCGPPAFQVRCLNNGSVASLRGSPVHALRIDYSNSSFVASHAKVADGTDGVCLADFNVSSSIALSPFKIGRSNRVMCFLYNCNRTEPRGRTYVNVTANCTTPTFAYLGGSYDRDKPPENLTGGCTYSYLPVLGSEAAGMTAANYSRLLKDGFVLEWAGVGDCSACNTSGGQCRYDNDSAAFACLCPDGRRSGRTCAGECHLPIP